MSLSFTIEGRMEEFDDYHVFSSPNASGALAKIAGGLNDDLGQRNLYESLPSQIGTAIKEGRAQAFTGSTVLSEKRLSLLSKLTGFDDGLTFFVIPFRWYGLGRTKRAGLICATSGSNYSSELGEEVLDLLRESAKKLTCMGGAASLRARDGSLAPIINGAREGTSILDFVEILKRSDIDAARIQYLEGNITSPARTGHWPMIHPTTKSGSSKKQQGGGRTWW
jgi:hypothetical protein